MSPTRPLILTVGGVAATGTIEDNDSAPTISSVTSESETEGTDLVHTVTLSNESAIRHHIQLYLSGQYRRRVPTLRAHPHSVMAILPYLL